jgi:hypothetical protein
MGFFGLLFWIVVVWLAIKALRGWARCGRRGDWHPRDTRERDVADEGQSYVEALESRVSELEERLDFTERLVASRG